MKCSFSLALLCFLIGCAVDGNGSRFRSEMTLSDSSFSRRINAKGDGWTLDVTWQKGELWRHIDWSDKNTDCEGVLSVVLQERKRPWVSTIAGVKSTSYGPYLPACEVVNSKGGRIDLTMTHEVVDFETSDGLTSMLAWDWYDNPKRVAVSDNGMLVALDTDRVSDGHMTVNIIIAHNRIAGIQAPASILDPFLKGRIVVAD